MVVYSVKDFCKYNRGAIKNVNKIHQEKTDNTYKCPCGHSVVIRPTEEKALCYWCNKWVFRRKEDEFKYRLKEKLK